MSECPDEEFAEVREEEIGPKEGGGQDHYSAQNAEK